MSSLDPATIAALLKEEAEAPTRSGGGRRGKADLTVVRDLTTWNKLNHHICHSACIHRTEGDNPTIPKDEAGTIIGVGRSCWNVDCMDHTRNKETDRGVQIVCEVKGVWMCRFCYLGKWLLDTSGGG